LADTRGNEQDELHKRDIAAKIQQHIDSVTAVLILANGTVPRITVGTKYALDTLSTLFPKSLAENIAFVFTNVSSRMNWNFSPDSIPKELRKAEQFLFNNPVALQQRFRVLEEDPAQKKSLRSMRKEMKAGEGVALEMLVKLFDWLDLLESQPTNDIVALYNKSQRIEATIADNLAQIDQAATKQAEIDKLIDKLQSNSKVSCSLRPCLWFNFILFYIGYRCFLRLRESHHEARLEAAGDRRHQYDMRPIQLLF